MMCDKMLMPKLKLKDRLVLKAVGIKQRDQVCLICRWSVGVIFSSSDNFSLKFNRGNGIFVKNTKARTVLFERGF